MMAAMCGNDATARILLRRKGKDLLSESDSKGFTPLFHAAHCGHSAVCQLLLEAGSDPDVIEDTRGFTPLMIAAKEGYEAVVQCLMYYSANLNYANILGESAKSVAAKFGHDRIVRMLTSRSMRPLSAGGRQSVLDGPAKLAEKLKEQKLKNSNLEEFLKSIGVEKYKELFEKKGVGLEKLLRMNDDELKDLGITLLGPRRKLTSAIAREKKNKN